MPPVRNKRRYAMADIEEIRKKVDKLITSKGFNYRDLSLKIGRKDSYIQQYVKYGYPRRLKEIDRSRLARLLDVDDTELMDDEIIASKASGLPDGKLEMISDIIKNSNSDENGLEAIDILTPQITENDFSHSVSGKQYISRHILEDITASDSKDIKIIKITSDSMKPSINPGDYVWLDTSYTLPETDGLYLFPSGRDINVKRIQISPLDSSVEISSDNPKYKTYKAQNYKELHTLGKIIALIQKI